MPPLTKRAIEALTSPPEKAYVYLWDTDPVGFGVRANRGGKKVYIASYTTKAGKRRFMTVCRVSDAPLDKARARAREIFYEVQQGKDPFQELIDRVTGITLRELRDRHLAEHAAAHNKPASVSTYRRLWDRVILTSKLGPKTVREITAGDVATFHSGLRATPYQANAAVRLLAKAFSLAELWGYRDGNTNPTTRVEFYPEEARTVELSADQMDRLGAAIQNFPRWEVRLALNLYLATGCRRAEVLNARLEDVNFERGALHLPDTKGGGLAGEWVPLPGFVLEEIRKRAVAGHPYIIPGRRDGRPLVNIYAPWREIRASAGLPKLRIHDLRHVFASVAHAGGVSQRGVADLLRHKNMRTTERYLHGSSVSTKANADLTAEKIAAAMNRSARQRLDENENPLGREDHDHDRDDGKPEKNRDG